MSNLLIFYLLCIFAIALSPCFDHLFRGYYASYPTLSWFSRTSSTIISASIRFSFSFSTPDLSLASTISLNVNQHSRTMTTLVIHDTRRSFFFSCISPSNTAIQSSLQATSTEYNHCRLLMHDSNCICIH